MLERDQGHQRTGLLLGAASAVSFGTLAIFAKFAYEEGAEPVPLLAVRFSVAALLLFAFNRLMGRDLRLDRKQTIRLLLLGAVGYAFESTLYFAALSEASAGVVGLVFYSYPLLTAIAAIALKLEAFHVRIVWALLLGMAGIGLIFTLPNEGLAGPLLALGAAGAVTIYYLFAQVFVRDVSPAAAATYTAVGAAVSLITVSGLTAQALPWPAWPAAIALGAVTAVAFLLLYGAVSRIGSARTSIVHMLEPVTTIILAALILGDRITTRIAIGALLVVSALPMLGSGGRAEPPAPDTV